MANRIEFKSAGMVRRTGQYKIRYTNDGASYFGGRQFDSIESALTWARFVGHQAEVVRLQGLHNPMNPHEVVARFDPAA